MGADPGDAIGAVAASSPGGVQLPPPLRGGSLLYSAPTSGGKSLVAEILLLRRLSGVADALVEGRAVREDDVGNLKAVVVLPFVAMVAEKAEALRAVCAPLQLEVVALCHGEDQLPQSIEEWDVCVCTPEKCNTLVNKMLDDGVLSALGVIVLDELHGIGDYGRGYMLEVVLAKLRMLEMCDVHQANGDDVRAVATSSDAPVASDAAHPAAGVDRYITKGHLRGANTGR